MPKDSFAQKLKYMPKNFSRLPTVHYPLLIGKIYFMNKNHEVTRIMHEGRTTHKKASWLKIIFSFYLFSENQWTMNSG